MGARDAQCLRTLTILAERTREPEFEYPHGTAQPSGALLWPPGAPGMHRMNRCICRQNSYTHKNKLKDLKLLRYSGNE